LSFSIERWLPSDEDLLQSILGTCDECFTRLSKAFEQDAEIAATRRNVAHNVVGSDLEACAEFSNPLEKRRRASAAPGAPRFGIELPIY
jgi:hypothetical protein